MNLDKYPSIREVEIPERINIFPTGSIVKTRMEFCASLFSNKESAYKLFIKSQGAYSYEMDDAFSWRERSDSKNIFKPGHVVFLLDSFRLTSNIRFTNNFWVFLYEEKRYMLMTPNWRSQQEYFDHT